MSPTITSAFILAASVAALLFWARSAAHAVLKRDFGHDYTSEVARGLPLAHREFRRLLQQDPAALAGCENWRVNLDRDFSTLQYLLRRTATRSARLSQSERILLLDFKLLRFWVGLKCRLSAPSWQTTLGTMTRILEYFGNVLGVRLGNALRQLEPQMAIAGEGPAALLAMCGYCRNVRVPSGRRKDFWVTTESYARKEGNSPVRLSHGICPDCFATLVKPTLAPPNPTAA